MCENFCTQMLVEFSLQTPYDRPMSPHAQQHLGASGRFESLQLFSKNNRYGSPQPDMNGPQGYPSPGECYFHNCVCSQVTWINLACRLLLWNSSYINKKKWLWTRLLWHFSNRTGFVLDEERIARNISLKSKFVLSQREIWRYGDLFNFSVHSQHDLYSARRIPCH